MLKNTVAVVLAAAAVLAGCSTTSGPTFNINEIQTSNGQKAFRSECYGALQSGSSCMEAAQKMCGNQPVNVLQNVEGTNAPGNAREVVFTCGMPPQPAAVQQAEPQPVIAAAPAVAPAIAPVRKVTLDEKTNFAFDSARLTPKARAILDRLIAEGRGVTFSSVVVEGYTDSTGSASYNVALSERRARAVLEYLKGHGLQAQDFATKALGESNPVASNATSGGRAENRRVEVVLTQ
ncbi:OmpA family protein [Caballeronia sp. LZ062]|uniref:OmpA family protein n=1 Tax=unclassified Caballeronia TaxID=2646786 RepID=UPI002867382F|nr:MULTISPECIES: OmpA family protein [unclassified Caballeronia]MDR5856873.1 OmpA family protein [Caballeronia sp. LZ050]MDR5869730.1 OmpA family protein [Caballeronia sp. LZ062]